MRFCAKSKQLERRWKWPDAGGMYAGIISFVYHEKGSTGKHDNESTR